MGSTESKQSFRATVLQLTTKASSIATGNDAFWDQIFFSNGLSTSSDAFTLVTATEIRLLRDESPSNLATLCYKAVEHLVRSATDGCPQTKHRLVLNCVRLLTRLLPYMFEDPEWRGFFWSTLPGQTDSTKNRASPDNPPPLAQSLLNAVLDLLFCPDFTVLPLKKAGPDNPEDLCNVDSCEYIWEAGVGFALSPGTTGLLDSNRTELLRLIITCFSEVMYLPPANDSGSVSINQWLNYFCSSCNRHALPLFTSLLNTVCAYDPVGFGVPYYHAMINDHHEPLVEVSAQLLVVLLDAEIVPQASSLATAEEGQLDNLFCNYMSRIHREEDFSFILRGLTRLLNNPLVQTYLPNSCKKVTMHQELLILFWKMCDLNKKFMYYVLKSSDVLDLLVPILFHLNESRSDAARVGLMHICVFILLLLSGERNFGVRLNKPYQVRVPMDIPVFTGTHADLLVLVFHKVITTGHQRLTPLFDCLLTIVVNVSPYLKSLSMVASSKLLHLMEAFSTPWYMFANRNNHHLVFFLLEIFNNIIQYQFDGNANLIYQLIRRRNVFHALANLPTDPSSVKQKKKGVASSDAAASTAEKQAPSASAVSESQEQPSQQEERQLKTTSATTADSGASSSLRSSGVAAEAMAVTRVEQPASLPTSAVPLTGKDGDEGLKSPEFVATREWIEGWKEKLPLQTVLRLLQVLVPQVEKICIDKGLTDESEILRFLQHGTLVGLLPVPHPILIRKYQANSGTNMWFRTYMWGVLYLRNVEPPIWYDTEVKLFEVQRV